MRSMATPNEIIDMKTRITPMALATIPICAHICIKSISPLLRCSGSSRNWSRLQKSNLLQSEIHRDGHDDRHRYAVEQRRRELPLLDGIECRLVEQRNRPQHLCVLHPAVSADRGLDDDHARHACGLGDWRIHGADIPRLVRGLDVAADPYRGR